VAAKWHFRATALVLQALSTLSDDATEFQIHDRLVRRLAITDAAAYDAAQLAAVLDKAETRHSGLA
jgi:hypothetical protein